MHEIQLLKDLVIIFGAAVIVVSILRWLHFPAIAGFIITGIIAGPNALGLISDTKEVDLLAEVGVILLLFGIGLEISLERIKRLWKAIALGGGIQVTLTVAATASVALLFDLSMAAAIVLGCVVAVSSTAVVLRGLSVRGELEAPHGRLAVGILVFQDLCVVPMILAVPILAGQQSGTSNVAATLAIAVAVLVGVGIFARFFGAKLLSYVAATRQREVFVLTVFLICFGIAWLLSLVGVSLALGAFIAGLVVADSEFSHQAMSEIIPARELFASLFFVSIGMLLDVSDAASHALPTLGLLAAILVGKFLIILITCAILRLPLQVAILSAAALCQVGEFSFVLLNSTAGTGIFDAALENNLLVAIIISMLITPMALGFGPHLAARACRVPWLNRVLKANPPGVDEDEPHNDHVIIAGYGLSGQSISRQMETSRRKYIIIDINPDNVRLATENNVRAVLGDISQDDVLDELAAHRARLIILNINNFDATKRALEKIQEKAPKVPVVVRTQFLIDRHALADYERDNLVHVISAEETARDALTAEVTRRLVS